VRPDVNPITGKKKLKLVFVLPVRPDLNPITEKKMKLKLVFVLSVRPDVNPITKNRGGQTWYFLNARVI